MSSKKPLKSIVLAPAGMRCWFATPKALVGVTALCLAVNPSSTWSAVVHVVECVGDTSTVVAEEMAAFRGCSLNGAPPMALDVLDKEERSRPVVLLDAIPVIEDGRPGDFAILDDKIPTPAMEAV